ncbi:MAG: hypothetical protein ABMA13_18380 [Chthoniobacteraceae bacterium]
MKFFGVTLGLKNAQFKSGLDEARGKVRQFKSEVSAGGGMMAGIGRQLAAIGIAAKVKEVIDYGDKIADLGQRFGVNVESLQKWGQVAETNGASLDEMAGGMNKLIIAQDKAIAGDAELQRHFASLGVSVDELKSMSPDELMKKIGGSAMNASDMVAVMGKSALALVPALQAVADGSAEFGEVMDAKTIAMLGKASDEIKTLTNNLKVGLGTALVFVADKLKVLAAAFGAMLAFNDTLMRGGSLKEAAAAHAAAYNLQRAEDNAAPPENKPKIRDDDADPEARAKAATDREKAQAEVDKAFQAQQAAIEAAQVKKSDDVQLLKLDRFKLTAAGRHAAEREDKRAARTEARADRAFTRRFGADELQRVKNLRDPEKQAEAAHKKALEASETKLNEAVEKLGQIERKVQSTT